MDKYANFSEKYASYMEKRALIETLLPTIANHVPGLAGHIPPDGVVGLLGTASKYALMRTAGKAVGTMFDASKVSKHFGVGLKDGFKMLGTPRANLVLGKHEPKSALVKNLRKVDKATDVVNVAYNGAMLAKNFI